LQDYNGLGKERMGERGDTDCRTGRMGVISEVLGRDG